MRDVQLERGKREASTGKKEVSDTESASDADRDSNGNHHNNMPVAGKLDRGILNVVTTHTIANGQGGLEARVRTVSKNPWCIVRQVVKISFSLTLSQSTLFRAPLCLSVCLSVCLSLTHIPAQVPLIPTDKDINELALELQEMCETEHFV